VGEEAFAEAKRRDVPVMISVGYSACHWCHVASDVAIRVVRDLSGPKISRQQAGCLDRR
jgi:hypothetical protein